MNLREVTHKELLEYFRNGWNLTETLFSSVKADESFYCAPDKLRHPLIFYLAHPAVFYINKMVAAGLLTEEERVKPAFEGELFAIGVDEMSWDDMGRARDIWPPVASVREYREEVKAVVERIIASIDLSKGIHWDSPSWSLLMGMEHERIHLETSSVLLRQMPLDLVQVPSKWVADAPASDVAGAHPNPMIKVETQVVQLGKPRDFPSYGWDNEYGTRVETVPGFQMSKYMITNSEFAVFVQQGGYHLSQYWTNEGWDWRTFVGRDHPLFWIPNGRAQGGYFYRTLFEERRMPSKWPVHVNVHEATAYMNWKTKLDGVTYRLPSEAEWYAALGGFEEGAVHDVKKDVILSGNASQKYNVDLRHGTSRDVDQDVTSSSGVCGLLGNAWEWMCDAADGFHGFKVHPYYHDFSTPCFDNRHNMIKGGSFISLGDEASIFARYYFRHHFYQHCGFRLVTPLPIDSTVFGMSQVPHKVNYNKWVDEVNPYETKGVVDDYLLYAYGEAEDVFPYDIGNIQAAVGNFTVNCAQTVIDAIGPHDGQKRRALEIGSAVGRASFELARHFDEVLGLEYSKLFVEVAKDLAEKGEKEYEFMVEGMLRGKAIAKVSDEIDRSRVSFAVGDACDLPKDIGQWDAVLGANLIDRTMEPLKFVDDVARLVKKGGIFVNTSPYTWRDSYTHRPNWLGGYEEHGEQQRTFEALQKHLGKHFKLVSHKDLPLLIREHSRKYQLCIAHCTVWQKQ